MVGVCGGEEIEEGWRGESCGYVDERKREREREGNSWRMREKELRNNQTSKFSNFKL